MGRLGQKAGKGWYRYDDHRKADAGSRGRGADPRRRRATPASPQRTFTDEEIVERCVYALINEGARILEEGFAARASDIDVIYLNGYGFPAWRGGPMFYADRTGLAAGSTTGSPRSIANSASAGRPRRCSTALGRASGAHVPGSRSAWRLSILPSATRPRDRALTARIYARLAASPLGPYPGRLTERLEHWAAQAPDRTFLARARRRRRVAAPHLRRHAARGPARSRRRCSIAASRRDRPIVILSGNSLEHALLGAGRDVRRRACTRRSRRPTALLARDYTTLRGLVAGAAPGARVRRRGRRSSSARSSHVAGGRGDRDLHAARDS